MPKRLTMKEVFDLPETFGAEDVGCPILLNTGLFVYDITKPWAESIWFESLERIGKAPDGQMIAQCLSEDWLFSARLQQVYGAKLYATRKVKLYHDREEFTNAHPWGEWQTDEDMRRERSWGGIWRRERDAAEERTSLSGLWARREYRADEREVRETSLLFGLVRWRVTEGQGFDMLPLAFPGPGWPAQRVRGPEDQAATGAQR